MHFIQAIPLSFYILSRLLSPVACLPDHGDLEVIERDVCILGGGSTGTYAAMRLRDMGKSFTIIERKSRLGGHTETYSDPATGIKADVGVVYFHDTDLVRNYFARLGVGLVKVPVTAGNLVTNYADFSSGKMVAPNVGGNLTLALGIYAAQLVKYAYVEEGFDLPDPVPEDLILPFGEFSRKYNIAEAFIPFMFLYAQGFGDLLNVPTIYVMKSFGIDIMRLFFSNSFLTTSKFDNNELYVKAAAVLGDHVNLSSEVVVARRTSRGVELVVRRQNRRPMLIRAKKLLVTIPPKLDILKPLRLDETERGIFTKFKNAGYSAALIRHSGIPDNTSITNVDPVAPYGLAKLPSTYSFYYSPIPGVKSVKYGSADGKQSDSEIKADILSEIKRMQASGTIPKSTKEPEIEFFTNHAPYELTVSSDQIRKGFYKKLYALQGHLSTYWTGAAFHTHDSSLLWKFTENLLPSLL